MVLSNNSKYVKIKKYRMMNILYKKPKLIAIDAKANIANRIYVVFGGNGFIKSIKLK